MSIRTGLTILAIVSLSPIHALAQASGEPRVLLVGVVDVAPFSIKKADGSWEGLSIDLWQTVASELALEYELREYASIEPLLEAIQAGDIDATPAVAASAQHEVSMDLSHSYYQSGSGIAVVLQRGGPAWFGVADRLFSWDFVRVIGLLLLVWLGAGAIVWLFERRRNSEMFGDGTLKGLGNGVWWAAVTMTTVGYGDKAPRTLGGRTVAIIWMLASIILISSFTAAITTSLTIDELSGTIQAWRDLPRVRAGSVTASATMRFLGEHGIAAEPFVDERDGLVAIVDGNIDAFAYNELVLRYLARTEFPGQVRVLPGTFDPYQVKVAVPAGSSLREPLNRALLKILDEDDWRRRAERYIGSHN